MEKKEKGKERKADQNQSWVKSDWKHFRQFLESKQRKKKGREKKI